MYMQCVPHRRCAHTHTALSARYAVHLQCVFLPYGEGCTLAPWHDTGYSACPPNEKITWGKLAPTTPSYVRRQACLSDTLLCCMYEYTAMSGVSHLTGSGDLCVHTFPCRHATYMYTACVLRGGVCARYPRSGHRIRRHHCMAARDGPGAG